MNNQDMRKRLLELPQEIAEKKQKIMRTMIEKEAAAQNLKIWEADQMMEISNITDDKGKKVYSNAAKRDAELLNRKENNERYNILQAKYKTLEREQKGWEIDLEFLLNTQSNLRAIARMEGRE